MATTWDPANKNAGITLSGGNLLATSSAGSGTVNQAVYATTAISPTVKQYFEITLGGTAGQYFQIGIMAAQSLVGNVGVGSTNGASFITGALNSGANSTDFVNGAVGSVSPPNPPSGRVIGVAVNRAANLIWWEYSNSVWFDGHGGAPDPGTGSGGRSIAVVTGTIYPAFSSAWTGDVATLNTGATAFAYAIPSGFVALDTSSGGGGGGTTQARALVLA